MSLMVNRVHEAIADEAQEEGYVEGYAACAARFAPELTEVQVKLSMALEDAPRMAELDESPHPDSYQLGYLVTRIRGAIVRLESIASQLAEEAAIA